MSEDTTQVEVPAETTAAEPSSAVETAQPDSEAPVAEDPAKDAPETEEEQKVPYSRFKEVNEKAKRVEELEARLKELESKPQEVTPENEQEKALKETFKNLGFVSREELQAEKQRQVEDAQLDKTLTQLETKYDGKDGRPKFSRKEIFDFYQSSGRISSDPEVLYKTMHEKEIINWNIQQAISKSKGVKSESSDGSGSANTGVTSDDLRAAAKSGDKDALRTYLKRLTPKLG